MFPPGSLLPCTRASQHRYNLPNVGPDFVQIDVRTHAKPQALNAGKWPCKRIAVSSGAARCPGFRRALFPRGSLGNGWGERSIPDVVGERVAHAIPRPQDRASDVGRSPIIPNPPAAKDTLTAGSGRMIGRMIGRTLRWTCGDHWAISRAGAWSATENHMPTGYTCGIEDGSVTTFPEFAILCARAFGATIMMRDEPLDAPIPDEFKPSDYHVKALARAQERLAEAEAMTIVDAQAQADKAHASHVLEWEQGEINRRETRRRYADMRAKVEAWTPPTAEHEGMKRFMLEQIDSSVSTYAPERPSSLTPVEWKSEAIQSALRDIEYHTKGDAAERERAAERTAWVRALRESLS